jgi:hypothetical protein
MATYGQTVCHAHTESQHRFAGDAAMGSPATLQISPENFKSFTLRYAKFPETNSSIAVGSIKYGPLPLLCSDQWIKIRPCCSASPFNDLRSLFSLPIGEYNKWRHMLQCYWMHCPRKIIPLESITNRMPKQLGRTSINLQQARRVYWIKLS